MDEDEDEKKKTVWNSQKDHSVQYKNVFGQYKAKQV